VGGAGMSDNVLSEISLKHRMPVDANAARVLFKSPWYCKLTGEPTFINPLRENTHRVFLSIFNYPDHKIESILGRSFFNLMVIGYCGTLERKRQYKFKRGLYQSNGIKKDRMWWVIDDDGFIACELKRDLKKGRYKKIFHITDIDQMHLFIEGFEQPNI
jgi:hypothetical protein